MDTKKWVWMILAACVVVGLFLIFTLARSPGASAPTSGNVEPPGQGIVGDAGTSNDTFDVVIAYTVDGYVPADISVKKGTRVRFINDSDEETWPASGIHPTHTLYPEKEPGDCLGSSFDACVALKRGEFFDFTFNYVGEWRFHDHVHAYKTGVVIVTE